MLRVRLIILLALLATLWACGGAGAPVGAPTVNAISPSTVAAGGSAFTLTVAGAGFGSAVVTFNGQALPTTVVSSTQVTAEVAATLIAKPGTAAIGVVNLPFAGAVSSNTLTLTIGRPSTLTLSKSHAGNFTQGQTGAQYTLTVRNGASGGTTSGTITVTDNLPAGLTLTGMSGAGWSCSGATCTRSDSLPASSSFAPITVTVNVASNAPATVTNSATLSGGGSAGTTVNDITTINSPQSPALSITKTHNGNFTQGQIGATYTITVQNGGAGPTAGTVTVTDALPADLTATGLAGAGWTCTLASLTCTRGDALAPGGSYPAITLTVNVAATAPSSVVNSATVSGGGSPSSTANDPTTITPPAAGSPAFSISKSHTGDFTIGQVGATYTIAVANSGSGTTSGLVTVSDNLPSALAATGMTGTSWACDIAALACTRGDALAAGSSYPPITLTVNVTATSATTVKNTATVSGGGAKNVSADDATVIGP